MTMIVVDGTPTLLVGPVLDSDGAAKTDEVVANIRLTKNGTVGSCDGSATLTHDHAGKYKLLLTANDTDTEGVLQVSLNSGTNDMPVLNLNVVPIKVYNSLVLGSDALEVDAIQWAGTAMASAISAANLAKLEDILDGTGGTGVKINQLFIDSSEAGGAFRIDNGSGPGLKIDVGTASGAIQVDNSSGPGLKLGAAAAGGAIDIDNSNGPGMHCSGTTYGWYLAASAGTGFYCVGGGNGSGIYTTGAGTGAGLHCVSVSGNGLYAQSAVSGAGIKAESTTSGDGFLAVGATTDINGDITGDLSGSVGSVTTKTGYELASDGMDSVVLPADIITAASVKADAVTKIQSGLSTHDAAAVLTALGNGSWATEAGGTGNHLTALPTMIEAAILDEGDATALLAAIAAKVEEFLINEGDATATIAAISAAVWAYGTRVLTANTNLNDLDAAGIRAAVGLGSANLDTQLGDVPTVAELESRTLLAAAYFDPGADEVTTDAASRTASKATGFATETKQDALIATVGVAGAGLTAVAQTGADSDTLETLSDQLDGLAALSGDGAYTGTLTIDDGATGLEGAIVNARQAGVLKATGTTDASGEITDWVFGDYTYTFAVRLAGYEPATDTLAISANGWTKTISLTAITITAPSSPSLCTVQFQALDGAGAALEGAICKAQLQGNNQSTDGTILSTAELTDTTDASGIAELELVRLDSIEKGTGVYSITVEVNGDTIGTVKTTVPNQATVLFEDLLP